MNESIAIVPNYKTAYVAVPILDDKKEVVEIALDTIVAWRVTYNKDRENSGYATAITVHAGVPDDHAVYFPDSDKWEVPEITDGKGLDSLMDHFKSEQAEK